MTLIDCILNNHGTITTTDFDDEWSYTTLAFFSPTDRALFKTALETLYPHVDVEFGDHPVDSYFGPWVAGIAFRIEEAHLNAH